MGYKFNFPQLPVNCNSQVDCSEFTFNWWAVKSNGESVKHNIKQWYIKTDKATL